jgi:hypothetical protein
MALQEDGGIATLDRMVQGLPQSERALFQRILHVDVTRGRLVHPDSMRPWIEHHFGRVEATLEQTVVRVTNLVTCRGALFNPLRSRRPHWTNSDVNASLDLDAEFGPQVDDPLEDPYVDTPEDTFGRVEGRFCVTAANIAKFDGFHALVVFKEHNPLRFSREMLHDYIDTGLRWAEQAHSTDSSAKYYLYMWNCLWRAGASLVHGHAQVMLGRGMHYPAVEHLRRASLSYRAQHNSNYFDDLYQAHASVGCAFQKDGVRILSNLAPVKEKEVLLIAPEVGPSLKDRLYEVLACFRDRLGVVSFNLAFHMPPLAPVEEDWSGFPVIAHLVDRGDPASRTSDIGSMELYGASVIASDPLQLARQLQDTLGT